MVIQNSLKLLNELASLEEKIKELEEHTPQGLAEQDLIHLLNNKGQFLKKNKTLTN